MLRPRGVLRREKGARELVEVRPDKSLNELLQDLSLMEIPAIDPLVHRLEKYKQTQAVLQGLKQKRSKLQLYKPAFNAKRSDPAYAEQVRQFDAINTNLQSLLNTTLERKERLEKHLGRDEEKKGLKSLQSYIEDQEREKEGLLSLQSEARTVFTQRGALCDSEGFYQHTGECWSDTIQQVLLNADGLKEKIQRQFILLPEIDTRDLPDELFFPGLNPLEQVSLPANIPEQYKLLRNTYIRDNKEFIQEQKKWVSLYFHEVKKRFLRHYLTESKRRTFLETCPLDSPISVAKARLSTLAKEATARKKGLEGISSAILGRFGILNITKTSDPKLQSFEGLAAPSFQSYLQDRNTFEHGGTSETRILLLNVYNYLFFSMGLLLYAFNPYNRMLSSLDPEGSFLEKTRGVLMVADMYKDASSEKPFDAHMFAFYTCGGQEFLYDDNAGLIPFPWKEFLRRYQSMKEKTPMILFVKLNKQTQDRITIETEFYPILRVQAGSPFTYFTFLEGSYLEISTLPYTFSPEGTGITIQLEQTYGTTLHEAIFICQENPPELQNVSYTFQPEARIGRLKEQNLTPFIAAVSEPNDEREALKQLALLDSPPLDLTVLTPKTAIPYPLVYLAVRLNWIRFLMALLRKGYDPNSKLTEGPRKGITALMQAVTAGKEDAVKILLDAKADPNLADEKGFRAIHNAVLQKNLSLVQLLVDAGADLNVQTYTGATPLYFAASSDEPAIVEYLCRKGADPKIKGAGLPNDPKIIPVMAAKTFQTKSILMRCQVLKGGTRRRRQGKRKTRRRN